MTRKTKNKLNETSFELSKSPKIKTIQSPEKIAQQDV